MTQFNYGKDYEKVIEDIKKKKLEFPYKKYNYTSEEKQELFKNLRNYKATYLNIDYKIKNVKIPDYILKYGGEYIIIESKNENYEKMNILSDLYNEECRMKCTVYKQMSPIEFYYKYPEKVVNNVKEYDKEITAKTLREGLYYTIKECTQFKPTVLKAIIEKFGSKRVLDFSAGWGDRLLAVLASDIELYIGIDPNKCLFGGYKKMIKELKSKTKCIMINKGFEEVDLSDYAKVDLVFTSPPYFDLEKYTTDEKQSIEKNKTEKDWFKNFLVVAIKKSINQLENGGYLILNINQKMGDKYVQKMLHHVKKEEKEVKYMGCIGYSNKELKNPQPMWVWRKKVN